MILPNCIKPTHTTLKLISKFRSLMETSEVTVIVVIISFVISSQTVFMERKNNFLLYRRSLIWGISKEVHKYLYSICHKYITYR